MKNDLGGKIMAKFVRLKAQLHNNKKAKSTKGGS